MPIHADGSYENRAVAHFGVSYKMVHSLSEIWSAAATPPLWLSSQPTVGKEHPLVRPAQPKAKAPPLAARSKWHRPIQNDPQPNFGMTRAVPVKVNVDVRVNVDVVVNVIGFFSFGCGYVAPYY